MKVINYLFSNKFYHIINIITLHQKELMALFKMILLCMHWIFIKCLIKAEFENKHDFDFQE